MKKAVITAKETVELQEFPMPEIREDQVLVKVKACGLCTFEQRYFTGGKEQYPFNGGHEVCGVVEQVGSRVASGIQPGDKVVVAAITRCGECYYCQRGMDNMCANGGDNPEPDTLWGPGGLSEYMVAEGYQVYKVSDEIDFSVGTLAEPLACVLRSVQKAHVTYGDTVVITGAGIMGLLHVKVAKLSGLKVIITEVDEARKATALRLGADRVVDPTKEDLLAVVREMTDGRGVEAVFYTAGGAKAAEQGIDALAKGGTIVFYGAIYPKGTVSIDPNKIHYDEINFTGLVSTTKESFRESARMLSEGLIDVREFISEEVPLEQIDYAFRRAVSPDTYRVIVRL
ncbi:zinc-binding dehydrogenase [Pseudoflavonifractor sp. DSM 107456]|uniref:Zinc-binding dehydrogenase n=1 Tax=Pseudoflavonifractor gallinarum TaxID=2779352 RepID=A0ABR9RBH7_9FIRM|nr:zinc-binding dehydrogenase [Pseudoflavonifractor gallinarum]MBE5056045.1 zinc-binding dehydrogenase [Pseudoflavonifractor gallinarum]